MGTERTGAHDQVPSGHAQTAAVGFGIVVLIFWPALGRIGHKWLLITAISAVLTIGFSRVAIGVHYPTDVAGGYLVGAAWLSLIALATRHRGGQAVSRIPRAMARISRKAPPTTREPPASHAP